MHCPIDRSSGYYTRRFRYWSTALIAGAIACSTVPNRRDSAVLGQRDLITQPELATVGATTQNTYSALERLRPLFLTTRPGSGTIRDTASHLYVFINDNFAGEVDALKSIPLANVESVRRVQATEAYTRYGGIHTGDGVILVRLRR